MLFFRLVYLGKFHFLKLRHIVFHNLFHFLDMQFFFLKIKIIPKSNNPHLKADTFREQLMNEKLIKYRRVPHLSFLFSHRFSQIRVTHLYMHISVLNLTCESGSLYVCQPSCDHVCEVFWKPIGF